MHDLTPRNAPRPRRRALLALLAVVGAGLVLAGLIVAVAIALHGSGGPPGSSPATTLPGQTTSQPLSRTATSATPEGTASSPTSTASTSSAARVSALTQLQAFVTAAGRMDRQLHAAASAVNGAGPPWTGISHEVAQTVKAADLDPVASTIPAGMPSALRLATFTVYSDLSSRRASMESFTVEHGPEAEPPDSAHRGTAVLLAELKNGVDAANRLDADVAALQARAASTDRFSIADPRSRATAEKLLTVLLIHKGDFGCDARGGGVVTELPIYTWTSATGGNVRMRHWPVSDAGLPFTAHLGADGRWDVDILVC